MTTFRSENDLVEENMPLVVHIVQKFKPKDIFEFEDYKQQGSIGLLKAIRKHDPTKGKLTTIAWRSIAWEIIRYINKENKTSGTFPIEDFENLYWYEDNEGLQQYVGNDISGIEKDILDMKMCGYKTKEISKKLNISKQKVLTHYKNTINKIQKCNES